MPKNFKMRKMTQWCVKLTHLFWFSTCVTHYIRVKMTHPFLLCANGLLMFTLSLIESSPAPASASSFDIEIQVSDSPSVQSTGKVNFSCCCLPGRRPNSLLEAFFRPASSPKDKVMLFRFHTHQPTGPLGCRCSCHKSVKK